MQVKKLCLFLLIGTAIILGGCSRMADPKPFSAFSEHKFNDVLSSLDCGHKDTLMLGTENGKIIFFNTNDASSHQVVVGDNRVYFVYQDTIPNPVTFIGVRNEGLKLFHNNHFDQPTTFKFGEKGIRYSVYRVERYRNWLICATSNGVALLNLDSIGDSLQPIWPDTVADDYKISAIQRIGDTLYASHDSLIHIIQLGEKKPKYLKDLDIPCRDKINNLYADTNDSLIVFQEKRIIIIGKQPYKNRFGVHSFLNNPSSENKFILMSNDRFILGSDLHPDSLSVFQLTLSNEQYTPTANLVVKNGYTYFISGTSLCQIPNHLPREKHFTAIDQNRSTIYAISDKNGVYSKENEKSFRRLFVIQHDSIKNEISQACFIQDKLCVLSGGKVYFDVDKRKEIPLTGICDSFQRNNITRIYSNPKNNHIFFAFREGYAYGETDAGKLIAGKLHYQTDLLSVQCFAQPNDSILYIGTLNHGCVVRNIRTDSTSSDTLSRNRTNIIDIALIQDNMFVLTPIMLYADSIYEINKTCPIDSLNIRNLNICKIYPLTYQQKRCLLGISSVGGLYVFSQDSLSSPPEILYPDILFYPDAIQIQDSIITAGTSIGLIELTIGKDTVTHREILLHEPLLERIKYFIQNHLQKFINIGIPAAIALGILILFLSIWSFHKTRKNEELNDQNKALSREKGELEIANEALKGQNTALSREKGELETANEALKGQNTTLSREKGELETANEALKGQNTILKNQKEQYEKDLERYEAAREEMRNDVLSDKLFLAKRNIGTSQMTASISKYEEYQKFSKFKEDLENNIMSVDKKRPDFYKEMQRCADTLRNKLWEPSLILDAIALRSWCIEHHQDLIDKDQQYVHIFREQIEAISKKIKEVVKFSVRRDEETQSIYLKLWSSALLLTAPTPVENRSKYSLKKVKDEENNLITKLLKPKNLKMLLFDEAELSDDNFAKKKSNLFADLEEMKTYQGKPNETPPVFKCENQFAITALEMFRDA